MIGLSKRAGEFDDPHSPDRIAKQGIETIENRKAKRTILLNMVSPLGRIGLQINTIQFYRLRQF